MKMRTISKKNQRFMTILVCLILFLFVVMSYFYSNPGEKGLDLAIFGYLMVLPSGLISLIALFYFRIIRKINFESIGRKKLIYIIIGNCLLIFPMTPVVMFGLHDSPSVLGIITPFVFQVLVPFLYLKMIAVILSLQDVDKLQENTEQVLDQVQGIVPNEKFDPAARSEYPSNSDSFRCGRNKNQCSQEALPNSNSAAFNAHNQEFSDVTFEELEIRRNETGAHVPGALREEQIPESEGDENDEERDGN